MQKYGKEKILDLNPILLLLNLIPYVMFLYLSFAIRVCSDFEVPFVALTSIGTILSLFLMRKSSSRVLLSFL